MLRNYRTAVLILLIGTFLVQSPVHAFFSANQQLLVALQLRQAQEAIQMINQAPPCGGYLSKMWSALRGNSSLLTVTDKNGDTPLMLAADQDLPDVIKALITKQVNVDQKDSSGNTALLRAVLKGNVKAVEALINGKVDLNVETKGAERALSIAIQNLDRPKMLKISTLLIQAGASLSFKILGKSFQDWVKIHRTNNLSLNTALKERGIIINPPDSTLFRKVRQVGSDIENSITRYLNEGDLAQLASVNKNFQSHTRKPEIKKTPKGPTFSAKNGRFCSIRKDQRLICWGEKFNDTQAGLIHTPPGLGPVKSVSVEATYACAIKVSGQLVCWGAFETRPNNSVSVASVSVPEEYALDLFQSVTTHKHIICAIRLNGEPVCWGKQYVSKTIIPFRLPPNLGPIDSISIEGHRACAVLKDSARVRCWDFVGFYHVNYLNNPPPPPLSFELPNIQAQSVSLLQYKVCLIQKHNHRVKCFNLGFHTHPPKLLNELPVPTDLGPVRAVYPSVFGACATTLESSHLKCWSWLRGIVNLRNDVPQNLGPIRSPLINQNHGFYLDYGMVKDGRVRSWNRWNPNTPVFFSPPPPPDPLNKSFWKEFGNRSKPKARTLDNRFWNGFGTARLSPTWSFTGLSLLTGAAYLYTGWPWILPGYSLYAGYVILRSSLQL